MHTSGTKYKSKIGWEFIIPVIAVLGVVSYLISMEKSAWIGLILILLVLAFITHMIMTTYYIIDNQTLSIKCGFFYHREIDINSIKKISESNNPQSAPATSLDRLEILFGKSDSILISPVQKKNFIRELQLRNPSIKVKLRSENS
ncbi:MAG: PH domain-containing protein [Saprospiraceae bacterium]|nr:PH domain-containing protein [Saprospiraceae bacterium]